MGRPSSSKKAEAEERPQSNAEIEERKRLKSLAISRKLLSNAPSNPNLPLSPSQLILKQQGRDIVKKGQRKNRFLFSFPGLLAPLSAGKIGELKDLGTKNPVLYIDFPQGRMKLFGTIVYPKNKYLTLQFGRGGKNVMCEDCFENMVVFSDAWWIGQKDENPEELQLELPTQLDESKHSDYDFKGGAGATTLEKFNIDKPKKEKAEPLSPDTELMDDVSVDSGFLAGKTDNDEIFATPIRQSARMAGKVRKYAESSSENDSLDGDHEVSNIKEEPDDENASMGRPSPRKTIDFSEAVSSPLGSENENTKASGKTHLSDLSVIKSKEASVSKKGSLVQATLTSIFDKVMETKPTGSKRKSPQLKGSTNKSHLDNSNRKSNKKKQVVDTSKNGRRGPGPGKTIEVKNKQTQALDVDMEEISSESQDASDSDEDWAA